MTRAGIFFFLLFCCGFYAPAQCVTRNYNFSEGKDYRSTTEYGLIRTSSAFLADSIEKADRMEMQYDGLQIRYGKKSSKLKYESLAAEYWGFVCNHIFYRFKAGITGEKATRVKLETFGNICLYENITPDDPIRTEDGLAYKYCYTADFAPYVSLGLDGPVIMLTNERFANLLAETEESLKTDYMQEFEAIKGAKLSKLPINKKETMELFIKYFEMVNNAEY